MNKRKTILSKKGPVLAEITGKTSQTVKKKIVLNPSNFNFTQQKFKRIFFTFCETPLILSK